MKTHQTDNLFFGVLTGFMSLTMMLVTCAATVQSVLPAPAANQLGQQAKADLVRMATELPTRQPVNL